MALDWLDTGSHGIRLGLEYGSVIDADTRGAITADTAEAEVSNLEAWIDTDDWPFTDNVNRLEASGSAVTDDVWTNLTAGTTNAKKLKELNPQRNALQYGNPVTRACTLSLSGIEAAGETLNGTHNFTFPALPYHAPLTPTVTIDADSINCTGNQADPAADRFWETVLWSLETNGVWAPMGFAELGSVVSKAYAPAANGRYRGSVQAFNETGSSSVGVSLYWYGAVSAPGAPSMTRSFNSTTINLSWAAGASPSYARTYLLERSLNGGAWTQIAATNGLAFADTVAVGSVAFYRVRAKTPDGGANVVYSAYSPIAGASPSGKHWTQPNPPTVGLALTGASTATITIGGNQNNPSIDKYWEWVDWQISQNGAAFAGGGTGLAGATTSILVAGLAVDSRYIVRASSRNSEGGSSAWVSSGAIYTKPDAPSAFTAERAAAGSTTVNFTWTNNAAWPGQYLIERSLDNGASWTQIISTSAASASTTQSISQAALYRMRVAALAGSEMSAYSGSVAVGVAFISDRTKMKMGTTQIDYIYVGTQRVRRVYRGTTAVWEDGDA